MVDEGWLSSRLGSALYASLVQVVELSLPAIGADVGAGRFFDLPTSTPVGYVSVGRLRLQPHHEPGVHDWTTAPGSIFEQMRDRAPVEAPFRPLDLLNGSADVAQLFGPVAAQHTVVDVIGTFLNLNDHASCLLIFFRCNQREAFTTHDTQRIQQMRPLMNGAMRRGLEQEQHLERTAESERLQPSEQATLPASSVDLMSKLSRTERRVLSYLRSRWTEREIAERMDRSPHTIHVHVKNIYRKCAVSSRKELLRMFTAQ